MSAHCETFTDSQGNTIEIRSGADGVTVSARIRTLSPYRGGADRESALAYARMHGLQRRP